MKQANQRSIIVVPQLPEHEELAKGQKWGEGKNVRGPRGIKDQLDLLKFLAQQVGNPLIYEDALRLLKEDPYGSIDGWDIDNKTSKIEINRFTSVSDWNIIIPEAMGAKWYTQTLWDRHGNLWFVGAIDTVTIKRRLDRLSRDYDNKILYRIIESVEPDAFIELLKKGG